MAKKRAKPVRKSPSKPKPRKPAARKIAGVKARWTANRKVASRKPGKPLGKKAHGSAKAVALLREQGFDRAVNLTGGILAWVDRIEPGKAKY